MGTTGRFGGGGHGLTGPKHIWYDTDYSELYKGLAVVIGFFLFLVLLLLIFILISYLRKWYRLKKRPNPSVSTADSSLSSVKASALGPNEDPKFAKKYSKSGLPSTSQPATPVVISMPKSSLAGTPVELADAKLAGLKAMHAGQPQQYHQQMIHHHPHYQEFPPTPHYPTHHHGSIASAAPQAGHIAKQQGNDCVQSAVPRSSRPSLATITLT